MHSRAADRRSASKCQEKWPDQTLDQAFGLPELLVAVSTSRLSCKRAGKNANIDAGLGFIWRISVKIIPNAFGERAVLKLMFGALIVLPSVGVLSKSPSSNVGR